MARIKFLQEDFAGFRPDISVKSTGLPRDVGGLSATEAVQALRGTVALAQETVGAGLGVADYLTKAGVIGAPKSKEALMEEAAKKKAEEVSKQRELEKQKLEQGQQTIQQREQMLMTAPKAGERQPFGSQVEIGTRQSDAINTITSLQDSYSKLLDPNIDPATFAQNFDAFNANVDKARKEGYASPEQLAQMDAIVSKAQAEALKVKQAEKEKINAERANRGVPPVVDDRGWSAEEIKRFTIPYNKALATGLSGGQEQVAKVKITPQIQAIADRLTPDRASTIFAELNTKDPTEITTEQRQLLEALKTKYPQFLQPAGRTTVQVPGPAEPSAPQPTAEPPRTPYDEAIKDKDTSPADKQRLLELRDAWWAKNTSYVPPTTAKPQPPAVPAETAPTQRQAFDKSTQDFIAGVGARKQAIEKDTNLTREELQREKFLVDDALTAIQKYEADSQANENSPSARAFYSAMEGLKKYFPDKGGFSKEALQKRQTELAGLIGFLADPETLNQMYQQEDVRVELVKNSIGRLLDATTELQALNSLRASKGTLTADEARRYVQLQDYVNKTKADLQTFENITQSVKGDPQAFDQFRQLAQQLQGEGGAKNLPPPETAEQKEQRFQNALKMFDADTAKAIDVASKQASKETGDKLYDANQVLFMAAQSALRDDRELGEKVLSILKSGNVVGIPPQQLSDIGSGAHKSRFYDQVMQTLFTRVKGKSEDELRMLLMKTLNDREEKAGKQEERLQRMLDRAERMTQRRELHPSKLSQSQSRATILADEASPEMLQAKRDQMLAKATDLAEKANTASEYYPLRLELMEAQKSYYANRNATEIAKARYGAIQDAVRGTQGSFNSQSSAERNEATNADKARVSQGLDKFSQFFKTDGKDQMVNPGDNVIDPLTGQKYAGTVPITRMELEIPTKARTYDPKTQAEQAKNAGDEFNAYVKSQGSGNKDAGRALLNDRRKKALEFKDAVGANRQDTNDQFSWKQDTLRQLTSDVSIFGSKIPLARSMKGDNGIEWMDAVEKARQEISQLRANLMGTYGQKLTKELADELKKERERIRKELNDKAKALGIKKGAGIPATATQREWNP